MHRKIRGRCDFDLDEKMLEIAKLKHDNAGMRKDLRRTRKNARRRRARKRRRSGG